MSDIYSYSGIPQNKITANRETSEGKSYSLNHPKELLVSMRYNGRGESRSNSQGWERNSSYYFSHMKNDHPEFFSNKNISRIETGESPKVDAKFIKNFPQYKGYEGESLVHHHIGKDGQAVAVPSSIHKGSGEIHTIENDLGVTKNAENFSNSCEKKCSQDPSMIGRTADKFNSLEKKDSKIKDNAFAKNLQNSSRPSSMNVNEEKQMHQGKSR